MYDFQKKRRKLTKNAKNISYHLFCNINKEDFFKKVNKKIRSIHYKRLTKKSQNKVFFTYKTNINKKKGIKNERKINKIQKL